MKKPSPFALLASALLAIPLCLQAAEVAATDPAIRYVGRFDTTDAAGPRAAWTASAVSLTLSGGSASVKLKDSGKNYWQVVIDGRPAAVLALEAGEKSYPIATHLPDGKHTVELVKRTEAFNGVTQLLGFEITDGARLLPTPARAHRVEVIGDSISCGYGIEAAGKEEKFTPATENGWLAYGAVAARAVNADYVCIAWSGRKLWPDNTIVSLYDRTLPLSASSKWDFAKWTPDVVVVNLGTNDFRKVNPEESGWVAAYVAFIKELRRNYPKAPVYLAAGPMISDWPSDRKCRTTLLGYLGKVIAETSAAGGPPVRLIDFGVQDPKNGLGADWHPSVKTHALMAEKLVAAFKADLGW